MKCEHCTRKECSKKSKTDDQENVSADASSPARENEEKGEFHKLADAKIFLSDCLACDSCVTVEEGVQLSQQSAKDFCHVLNLNKKCDTSKHRVLVVSLCVLSLCLISLLNSTSVSPCIQKTLWLPEKSWGALCIWHHNRSRFQHPGDSEGICTPVSPTQ